MNTYGVEFEVLLPKRILEGNGGEVYVGSYLRGASVPTSWALPGWKFKSDCTVNASNRTRYESAELVSPILRGLDGYRQIIKACAKMNELGVRVNATCGFHVHVGWTSNDLRELRRLTHWTAQFQEAFYAASGTKRRKFRHPNGEHYCRPIKESHKDVEWNKPDVHAFLYDSKNRHLRGHNSRYHFLNLHNILEPSSKRTVEFRCFSGTTEALKAISWVRMCLAVVHRTAETTRLPKWDCGKAKGPWVRKDAGEGATEMGRFFCRFGWVKWGTAAQPWKKAYGIHDGEAEAQDLPTLEATRDELRRLAKKFDDDTRRY
jgi:hypothetical protein